MYNFNKLTLYDCFLDLLLRTVGIEDCVIFGLSLSLTLDVCRELVIVFIIYFDFRLVLVFSGFILRHSGTIVLVDDLDCFLGLIICNLLLKLYNDNHQANSNLISSLLNWYYWMS